MKKGYASFASLCEEIIKEESTTIDKLRGVPGGAELGRFVHKNFSIPHDADFQRVDKLSFRPPETDQYMSAKMKAKASSRWFVVAGQKGSAFLIYYAPSKKITLVVPNLKNAQGLEIYMRKIDPSNDQFLVLEFNRATDATSVMRQIIGKPVEVYEAYIDKSTDVQNVRSSRMQRQKKTRSGIQSDPQGILLKKFSPLFIRVLKQAEAELRGMAGMQLKQGAYTQAQTKLRNLASIQELISVIEEQGYIGLTSGSKEKFKNGVGNALIAAAFHFYPDIAGEYPENRIVTMTALDAKAAAAVNQLVSDIANGDTKKLSGVLFFFKNIMLRTKWSNLV